MTENGTILKLSRLETMSPKELQSDEVWEVFTVGHGAYRERTFALLEKLGDRFTIAEWEMLARSVPSYAARISSLAKRYYAGTQAYDKSRLPKVA